MVAMEKTGIFRKRDLMAATLKEKTDEYVASKETALGQQIPITERSYLFIESRAQASLFIAIDKKAELAVRENLAISATRDGLIDLGREFLSRDPYEARKSQINGIVSVGSGITVPPDTGFVCSANGLTYYTDSSVTGTGGDATIPMTCEVAGVAGNVGSGEEITIQTVIVGVSDTGVTGDTLIIGTEREGTEEYRTKILDAERGQGGGSNSADYRNWGQEVEGVTRCYPYAGRFDNEGFNIGGPSSRTVFVQASTDIDSDGIAPQALLDEVRSHLITDPVTGRDRICMGVPNDTLYVESIRRILFDVNVYGSTGSWSAAAVSSVNSALADYLSALIPTIEGLDPIYGKTNEITEVSLANVVHDALLPYGLTAERVDFSLTSVGDTISKYTLPAGGLSKLNGVSYP